MKKEILILLILSVFLVSGISGCVSTKSSIINRLESACASEDVVERAQIQIIFLELTNMGDSGIDLYKEGLKSESLCVKAVILEVFEETKTLNFEKINNKDFIEPIEAIIENKSINYSLYGDIRGNAVQALGKIKSDDISSLIRTAEDANEDHMLRIKSILALGNYKTDEVINSLIKLLKDGDWEIRYKAIQSLGSIGDAKAVPSLEEALEDKEWINRMNAAVTLKKITGNEYSYEKDCPWNCKDKCETGDRAKTEYYCETGECCINLKESIYVSCQMWAQVGNTGVITTLKNINCSFDSDCTKNYFDSFCEISENIFISRCSNGSDLEFFCEEGMCMQPCS